jgi:hypothetical protein
MSPFLCSYTHMHLYNFRLPPTCAGTHTHTRTHTHTHAHTHTHTHTHTHAHTAAGPTHGPSFDVLEFLEKDSGSNGGGGGVEDIGTPDGRGGDPPTLLRTPSKIPGGDISELWLVDYSELDMQKQVGEGSFGKVHLAMWRETTVAVKVLNMPGGSSSLDEEFPELLGGSGVSEGEAGGGRGPNPLYKPLQQEAAMMASLRHPSIVM